MVTAVHSVSLDLILINYKLTELILYQKSRNFGPYFFLVQKNSEIAKRTNFRFLDFFQFPEKWYF